jgi:regulator of sigma E protease
MARIQGQEGTAGGGAYPPVTPGKKFLVSVAGSIGNILLAVALAWVVFLLSKPSESGIAEHPILGYVDTNSAAFATGLRAGDEILSVNSESVGTWQEFLQLATLASNVTLAVRHEDAVITWSLDTAKDDFGIRTIPGIESGAPSRVLTVESGKSADRAGMQSGDVIKTFDGIRVGSNRHLVELVAQRPGRTVPVTVLRQGKTLEMQVTPELDPELGRARIGIHFDTMGIQMDELAQRPPLDQIRHDATAIVRMLRALVTPREARQAAEGIGGPPMILVTFWYVVKVSLLAALSFTRFLNVNLAIINLLPFPVLDGGHIMFAVWEIVTRRRVHPRVADALVNVFAVVLIGLMIFLSFRDIGRLANIRKVLSRAAATNAVPQHAAATNGAGASAEAAPAPAGR